MIRHMKIHPGKKPFSCIICSKAYAKKEDLKKREISHNKLTVVHGCEICHLVFATKFDLMHHVKNIHAEVKKRNEGSTAPPAKKGKLEKSALNAFSVNENNEMNLIEFLYNIRSSICDQLCIELYEKQAIK